MAFFVTNSPIFSFISWDYIWKLTAFLRFKMPLILVNFLLMHQFLKLIFYSAP